MMDEHRKALFKKLFFLNRKTLLPIDTSHTHHTYRKVLCHTQFFFSSLYQTKRGVTYISIIRQKEREIKNKKILFYCYDAKGGWNLIRNCLLRIYLYRTPLIHLSAPGKWIQ